MAGISRARIAFRPLTMLRPYSKAREPANGKTEKVFIFPYLNGHSASD
jgi:hypothetical protein